MDRLVRHLRDLWSIAWSRQYRVSQLETYSLLSIVFNRRRMRRDYVEFTAKRYAASVRASLAAGYQPLDRRHLSEQWWREELTRRQ